MVDWLEVDTPLGLPGQGQGICTRTFFVPLREGLAAKEPEVHYYATSLAPHEAGAAKLARLIRGHWGIENRLHHSERPDVSRGPSLGEEPRNGVCPDVPTDAGGRTAARAEDTRPRGAGILPGEDRVHAVRRNTRFAHGLRGKVTFGFSWQIPSIPAVCPCLEWTGFVYLYLVWLA